MDNTFLLIIGAPKCGTTSLANWLAQHPRFFLSSRKEPGFFRSKQAHFILGSRGQRSKPAPLVETLDEYYDLYRNASPDQILIDASTDYLSDDDAPKRIEAFSRNHRVKLLCLLRDPIDRAFSEYRHTIRDGIETESFLASLQLEADRRRQGFQPLFFHAERSRYFEQIERFRRLSCDLMLLEFDDLKKPDTVLSKIFQFIDEGLEPITGHDFSPENESKIYVSKLARRIARSQRAASLLDGAFGATGARMWRKLESLLVRRVEKDEQSVRYIYSVLSDDIERCLADPGIPTTAWRTTLALRRTMSVSAP